MTAPDRPKSGLSRLQRRGAVPPINAPLATPVLIRQNGEYLASPLPANWPVISGATPGSAQGAATPATPGTMDRGRRYRALVAVEPRLPHIIEHTTRKFAHLAGSQDKKGVTEILLTILGSFTIDDATLRKRVQDLAFESVCAQLGIDRCIYQEIQSQVDRCCRDRFACLPCFSAGF